LVVGLAPMSRRNGFADTIVGLLLLGWLSSLAGGFLNSQFKFVSPHSATEFGIGIVVLILIGGVLAIGFVGYQRLQAWRESWTRCVHGVAGGGKRNLCQACVDEQLLEETNRRIKIEAEERCAFRRRRTVIPIEAGHGSNRLRTPFR